MKQTKESKMKLLFILTFLFGSCSISRPPSNITVTVDYILRVPGDSSEVWAKRRRMYNNHGYVWYMAKMVYVPDSIKIGKQLVLNKLPDTCNNCILFKQVYDTKAKRNSAE